MNRALLLACLLCGCGGLQNEPFTRGSIAGRLVNADSQAVVSIIGQPEFSTRPDADGAFTLEDVPAGDVELFIVVNGLRAQRQQVTVSGGSVSQLGSVEGAAASYLTVEYEGPEYLRLYEVSIELKNTPVPVAHTQEGLRWVVPAGCYLAHGEARGLRPVEAELCVVEGEDKFVELHPLPPDGTQGNEGCVVGDCDFGSTCQSDGSCML